MNRSPLFLALALTFAVLAIGMVFWSQAPRNAAASTNETVELAEAMSRLQTYAHKLILSADAGNAALMDFYLHEIEELVEEIAAEVPEYEGHPVGQLVETMLLPEVERLEETVDGGEWPEIQSGVERLVTTCNACHDTTEHAFIRIPTSAEDNPFLQDFRMQP